MTSGMASLGAKAAKTLLPNLDAMAEAGVHFTSGYVTRPVCSPTRAGLLTNKYQHRFGHENNIARRREIEHPELMGLPVEEKTIADRTKAAGYRTACIQKWHLGAHEEVRPPRFYSLPHSLLGRPSATNGYAARKVLWEQPCKL